MLSITAGAQKEMMSYIDLLGVNNIIVEAKEAVDRNELQARRAISPGLTFRDYRAISRMSPASTPPLRASASSPPSCYRRPSQETARADRRYAGLSEDQQPARWWKAGSSTRRTTESSAPVCVLGESAKVNLLGYDPAVGKYVKVNDTWLQVIGVLAQQATGR